MRTVTFETPAWVFEHDVQHCLGDASRLRATAVCMFDFNPKQGYVRIGTARMEVQLMDERELRASTADAIRTQIEQVRAEAQNAITELTRKLNEVLAIECEEATS